MTYRGYALTIAGCEHVFTTGGLPSLSSASVLWPSPTSTADGFLVSPTNVLSERANPLEGDLDVPAQRFQLHDAKATTGGASRNLLTWLATRNAVNVTSTALASSVTASALSFVVGNAAAIPTLPAVLWIEGEALQCASIAGSTVTVTTRGVLGTKATAHRVDAGQGLHPEVFTSMPWIVHRKVCLWAVDSAGVCTLLWMGYAQRAPALSDDGARFDLHCDHAWTVQKNDPVGGSLGSTRLVGYGSDGVGYPIISIATHILANTGTEYAFPVTSVGPHRTWDALAREIEQQVEIMSTAAYSRLSATLQRDGRTAQLNAFSNTGTIASFSMLLRFGDRAGDRTTSTASGGSRADLTLRITDAPSVLYVNRVSLGASGGTFLVSGTSGLHTSWSSTITTESIYTTVEVPGLRCLYSEDWQAIFTGLTIATSAPLGARATCAITHLPRKPGLAPLDAWASLRDPPPLQACYRVTTGHWAWGLKHSVLGLCETAHANDWSWDNNTEIARLTSGLRTSRDWIFDGKRTLGDVVKECCLLHGCSPVLVDGRITLHPWAWPDAHTTPAVSLAATDIIGRPSWSRWQDGIANRIQLKSADLTVDITQAQSRARYGPGRQIKIELAGLDDQASPVDDVLDFARTLGQRLALWSEPLAAIKMKLSASYATSLRIGSELVATEWMLPDGAGARGLSATRAVVIARDLDLGAATLTVEALVFARSSYPYAPCGRVGSQVSTTIVELAANYVGGSSTYSGGNDSTTFAVGDICDLISREASPTIDAGVTITAINTTTRRITFAAPMSAGIQARIAAGARVDLRFAAYGTPVVASQESWMYVGDDTSLVIDGTADVVRVIAP